MERIQTVLIVDDAMNVASMVKEGLSLQGYRCMTAVSAASGLDLMLKVPFDLVITDISMPDMDGFEFTKQIKKLRPATAVMIMTGFIENFVYDQAIAAGAADFIKKPFTLKELIARISHVERQESIRNESFRDPLTGLYNRRGLFALIEHFFKLAKRQKKGMYLLYADLDGLKKINDTWGHQSGDEALIATADILRKNYRDSDLISRIGGDEFVVVPIGAEGDRIEYIFERLQKALDAFNAPGDHPFRLSISGGLSYYDPSKPCSLDELIHRGDLSMYERKKSKG